MEKNESLDWKILNIVNTVSLIAAVVTCAILVGLGIYKYRFVDRVSLRFQGFIALIDIIRHLSHVKVGHSNSNICQAIAFFLYFADQLYVLLNIAIALNIQLMLIQHVRPNKRLQWYYGVSAIVFASLINLIPLAMGKYGLNSKDHCRLVDSKNKLIWHTMLIYITNIPGLIYCLFVFISVTLKLRDKKLNLRLIRGSENNFGKDPFKFVWTLYFRVSLYPLSCFVTLLPYTLVTVLIDSDIPSPSELKFVFRFCRRITGTLNFMTMICDPHCQTALKFLYNILVSSKPSHTFQAEFELPSLRSENPSISYHHELEYPNGDRVRLNDYIKLV